ncbi:hypothetical protein ACUN9Y_19700 [Halomonas sp. V046]|uniref:hypothetical protein n=1 Tax=Halomonas sp. V046 TaxID=3459611 RepID=UPI0040445F62
MRITSVFILCFLASTPVLSNEESNKIGEDYYNKGIEELENENYVAALNNLYAFRAMNDEYLGSNSSISQRLNEAIKELSDSINNAVNGFWGKAIATGDGNQGGANGSITPVVHQSDDQIFIYTGHGSFSLGEDNYQMMSQEELRSEIQIKDNQIEELNEQVKRILEGRQPE